MTYADMAKYGEIVSHPDRIVKGLRPGSIIYEKRFPDGTLYVSEQILKGNNIELRSMYKNKIAEKMRASVIAGSPARTKGERVNSDE